MTEEQREIFEDPSTDPFTTLNRLLILSSLETSYTVISLIMGFLTIIFIIAIAVAINEFVPFT